MGRKNPDNITPKVGHILNGILVALILILFRIWHLAVVQHDAKVVDSHKPQRRTVLDKADRAIITDRVGLPLALNKVQYNVSISYGGIREIPRSSWQLNPEGKKIKVLKRKEYIENLSKMLGAELSLDPQKIEDLIHAKAAGFGNIPVVIKENISEKSFLKLKMLEKDYPGLIAEKVARRCYPQGRVGADIVGYLGAISNEEYHLITNEMQMLQHCMNQWEDGADPELPKGYYRIEEVGYRLKELESKAYRINDLVGKAGIEKAFEERLRGSCGFKTYLADTKGNFLKEIESNEKKSGSKITLTISKELQEYAERLLAEYEKAPLPKSAHHFCDKQPWIKGGAVVAMCPKTGQIYALASYPRFDPNDFIKYPATEGKKERVCQWLENENYIGYLWDEKIPLRRERFDLKNGNFYEEEQFLNWETYLDMVLAKNSTLWNQIHKIETIQQAITLQQDVMALCQIFATREFAITPPKIFDFVYFTDEVQGVTITLPERDFLEQRAKLASVEIAKAQEKLQPFFSDIKLNYEKLALVDLARVGVYGEEFPAVLLEKFGNQTLSSYKTMKASFGIVEEFVQKKLKQHFRQNEFKKWRECESKDYIAKLRKIEETEKKRPRPYIEYLDEMENKLFNELWEKEGLKTTCEFVKNATDELENPILNKARTYLKELGEKTEAKDFLLYLKSAKSYDELNGILLGSYPGLRAQGGKLTLKSLAGAFYPRSGFGHARSYAFRQSASVGSIFKIVPAYEALRQRLGSLENDDPSHNELNPLTIVDDKRKVGKEWRVGYTEDNKAIPRYYRGGLLPRSEHSGIGEVDIVQALAASSNPYFALLAGDVIDDPEDLCRAANLFSYGERTGIELPGEIKGNVPRDVIYDRTGLYSLSIGQHSLVGTPLQSAVMLATIANGGTVLQPKIVLKEENAIGVIPLQTTVKRQIAMPKPVRDVLMKGLKEVIMGEKGTGRILKQQFPKELLSHIVGKTSTAESMERLSLDAETGKLIVNHVGFGAIYFDKVEEGEYLDPKLVVVVYLRFGEYGKTVAPYTVKMIQKWLELNPTSAPGSSS